MIIYNIIRRRQLFNSAWDVWRASRSRQALVVATGGHFAGVAFFELVRTLHPLLFYQSRTFSVLKPLPELEPALNDFKPTVI